MSDGYHTVSMRDTCRSANPKSQVTNPLSCGFRYPLPFTGHLLPATVGSAVRLRGGGQRGHACLGSFALVPGQAMRRCECDDGRRDRDDCDDDEQRFHGHYLSLNSTATSTITSTACPCRV